MSSSTVEKIKERLDIADIIGGYIKLENAGASLKGNCPFHNEKSPSFFVSPARGSYYCFGCGAKGDVFTFVQEFEGLDFVGALKLLAEKAGVEIETRSPVMQAEHNELRKILDDTNAWFVDNLKAKTEAYDYLTKRGLSNDVIHDWGIGYAPLDWRLLFEHLKSKGYSESLMIRAGVVKKTDTASSPYDVFRGRIMFPISDSSGHVIAWSGRLFGAQPDAPKYLNSPETEVFKKSEVLYGFHKAKQAIRKKGYSILVEGQMDLLLCHQHGFENAVATSGTALTLQHLDRLKRLSPKIMMVFDGDEAGKNAARKSAELALSASLEAKIALLPEGKDPADVLTEDKEIFVTALRGAQHVIDFALHQITSKSLDPRSLGRVIGSEILPMIAQLGSSIEESHFVAQISKKTGIKEDAIWTDLRRLGKVNANSVMEQSVVKSPSFVNGHIMRRLIGIILWQKGVDLPYIDPSKLEGQVAQCVGKDRFDQQLKEFDSVKDELVFEAESYYASKEALERDLDELLDNLRRDEIDAELETLQKYIYSTKDDSPGYKEKLLKFNELSKEKDLLSSKRKTN